MHYVSTVCIDVSAHRNCERCVVPWRDDKVSLLNFDPHNKFCDYIILIDLFHPEPPKELIISCLLPVVVLLSLLNEIM